MPGAVRDRLSTVFSLGSDYNVTSTREGRLLIWGRNLPLVASRPWGYGAGSSAAVDGKLAGGRYRQLHNMYLEVLVELGVPGFIAFLLAFTRSWRVLLARRPEDASEAPGDVEVRVFRRAVAVSLVGIAVCGFFLSMCYTPCLWLMVTFACVLARQGAVLPARRPLEVAT
jgi:O-antigen ligase